MTLTTIKSDKNKSFILSEQVKRILHEKGFLKIFNYPDYNYFKELKKNAFNKAFEIATLFIADDQSTNTSDLQDYIF
ncbi:hypothetical protein [Flavicella sp.]|uniref:hypothetical protein n=1 Tax=Flavicella sp. TaxID=2957742 RepID=UPI00301A87BC